MNQEIKGSSVLPDSIFSQSSSHDTAINDGLIPTLSAMSVLSPFRSSVTLANINHLTNTQEQEYENFFHNAFNSRRSLTISRWQSDGEVMNTQHNLSKQLTSNTVNYFGNDFLNTQNIASSSMTDTTISPMSQLSASSSMTSFNSMDNPKLTIQRPSQSIRTGSYRQTVSTNENNGSFSSASSFLPLPKLSNIINIPYATTKTDYQRVPPSFGLIQPPSSTPEHRPSSNDPILPQVLHSATRPNTMPSWRGYLPTRIDPSPIGQHPMTNTYSPKVFLGGIAPELTEAELLFVLRKFGKCTIKWPKNDGISHSTPGFCHVVFREARSVSELLKHCTRQQRSTIDYFLHIHISSTQPNLPIRSTRFKPIQVVPWNMNDNVYGIQQENINKNDPSYKDWSRTIFVSPLHGKMTAFSLTTIMSSVFGKVLMAQINTDKYGYPTGTGTVLFNDCHSYMRAVAAGNIDIKCDSFHKLLDIDPFLRENEPCGYCSSVGEMFCRNFHCLRSYCKDCWVNTHGPKPLADHQPATRRTQTLLQV